MDEREILKEEKAFCIPDATDREIMQALSGELSEITVSKELFERTCSAARGQKNRKKRERGQRFAVRMFVAAAAVLVAVLGLALLRSKGNLKGGSADGTIGGEDVCGSAALPWDAMEAEGSAPDGGLPEPEPGSREWLYDALLAAFAKAGDAAVSDTGEENNEFLLPEETQEETRHISWQQDGRELSCIIYGGDYRIVATLREDGAVQTLELRDWVYAPRVWELAAE